MHLFPVGFCGTIFLYISLPSLHDYDAVKMPNFTSYVGRENQNNDFLFSFVNLETIL